MRKFTLLIILLSFFSLGMARLPQKPTQIKGKVTNSKTNLPLPNVQIKLFNISGQLKASTKTNSKGDYTLKVTLPRTSNYYKLTASKDNYNSRTIKLSFYGGRNYVFNFRLLPKPKPNQLPKISSITPANGSTFLAGAKITIRASASDLDKDPLQYRFFIGGSLKQNWSSSNTYTWQTKAQDTAAVTIRCEVRDNKGGQASKTIGYSIINPAVQEVLKKVADNYAKFYDMKADMTLSSTLDGKPFGETEYCRYYFKAPNKEKTETFSDSYRTTKTDIIIINGSTMHLIDPVDNIKQQVDLLADAGISSSQFNQMDIYYNQANFLNSHTVTKNNADTDFNNTIIALDAVPKTSNNIYDKLGILIDYSKGIITKYSIYKKSELNQLELVQEIKVIENLRMSNSTWVPSKMVKTPNLTKANFISTLAYNNL